MAELTPNPRGVRVSLEAATARPDDPVVRVAPADEPLHMTNPSVGTGPLGGIVILEPPLAGAPVLVQRQAIVDGVAAEARLVALGGDRYVLRDGAGTTRVVLGPRRAGLAGTQVREVLVDGFRLLVEVEDEHLAALRERASKGRSGAAHHGPLAVKAIIPGKVVAISVAPGDAVVAGQQLLVVEAMKMQNELRAPRDGTIERVGVAVGQAVDLGDLLVVIS